MFRNNVFMRNSNFISDFSVTVSPASIRYSMKSSELILPSIMASESVPNTSWMCRVGTRQLLAARCLFSLINRNFATSAGPMEPLPSSSISSNKSWSVALCSRRSSSSVCIFSSCSWVPVLVIIFSLTTAVRIDRSVQELVIIKNTKANFNVGNVSKMASIAAASLSDEAPLITRKRVNMLSGTVLNGMMTSSEIWASGGNASLCPIKLVVMMAMP
mmetsp:Transcript_20155/g.39361  ORF Transcript_20155/g.39361 Transcript_20155/m.39361 type:complete len:216 (-) Transcript_20155:1279-1926(-)